MIKMKEMILIKMMMMVMKIGNDNEVDDYDDDHGDHDDDADYNDDDDDFDDDDEDVTDDHDYVLKIVIRQCREGWERD